MIKAIIIDDEPGNIVTLEELLKLYNPEVQVLQTALNPIVGQELILKHKPDIVFLDIEMPYGNAFSMLDKLAPVNFEVIFVTAFNEYAIKAFRYAALDYILKPVNLNELKAAVDRAIQRLDEKKMNTRVDMLLNNMKVENHNFQKIGLPTQDGFRFESIQNIVSLEANGSYTNINIKGNVKEMVSKNLAYFEDLLPSGTFCRIHHSTIINLNFIKKYFKGRGGYVEMENGSVIEVSVRKKEDFLSKFVH
jgi:two-component system, LytTR family, response regulator